MRIGQLGFCLLITANWLLHHYALLDVPMGEVPCVTYGLTPFSRGVAEITDSIQKKKTGGGNEARTSTLYSRTLPRDKLELTYDSVHEEKACLGVVMENPGIITKCLSSMNIIAMIIIIILCY